MPMREKRESEGVKNVKMVKRGSSINHVVNFLCISDIPLPPSWSFLLSKVYVKTVLCSILVNIQTLVNFQEGLHLWKSWLCPAFLLLLQNQGCHGYLVGKISNIIHGDLFVTIVLCNIIIHPSSGGYVFKKNTFFKLWLGSWENTALAKWEGVGNLHEMLRANCW